MMLQNSFAYMFVKAARTQTHREAPPSGVLELHGICRHTTPDDMPTAMKPCCAATTVLVPSACDTQQSISRLK